MVFLFSASIYLAERYVILFSLAFSGAYMFIFGLDLFIHTGFVNAAREILDHNGCHFITYRITTGVYVMLAMVIVLTLLSFGWQYYWNIIVMHRAFGVNVVPAKAETVIVEKVSSAGSAAVPTEVIVEKGPSSHHSAVVVEKAPTSHHTEEVVVVPSSHHSHHSAPLSVIRENASAIASGAALVKGSSHHTSHHTPVVVTSAPRSVIESIAPSTHHTVISPSRHSVPVVEGSRSIISPSRHSGGGLLSGASNVIPILAGTASRHSVAPTGTRSARGTVLPVPSASGSRHTGSRSVVGSGSGSGSGPAEVIVVPSAHSRSGNGSGSHHTSRHSSHHTSHHSLAPSAISRSIAAASAAQSGTKSQVTAQSGIKSQASAPSAAKSQATAKSASGRGSRTSAQPDPDIQSVSSTTVHVEPPSQLPARKLFGIIPL